MAELNQVVGTLLRDIAQGRVTSDLYSRDISKFYEQDSILRVFPVPRPEISDIEIDFKFAFKNIEEDTSRTESLDNRIQALFERFSLTIAQYSIKELLNLLKNDDKIDFSNELWKKAESRLQSKSLLEDLTAEIYEELHDARFKIVGYETKTFQVDLANKAVGKAFEECLFPTAELKELFKMYPNMFEGKKLALAKHLFVHSNKMQNAVLFILKRTKDYKADVMVNSGDLVNLKDHLVASIKVNTKVRNYKWTKINEDDEGNVERRLIPE